MNSEEDNQVYKGKINKKNNVTQIKRTTDKYIKTKYPSITMQTLSHSDPFYMITYIHRLTYQLISNQLNDRMTR